MKEEIKKETKSKPRYSAFNNVRYIMKMLWKADKGIVIYSMFKAITENIFYVFFYVYITKYIYICIEQHTPFNYLLKVITFMCVLHVLIHISSAGHSYYLKVRTPEVYRYIFGNVIDKSEKMEYKRFDQPDFYDKFTRALNESGRY